MTDLERYDQLKEYNDLLYSNDIEAKYLAYTLILSEININPGKMTLGFNPNEFIVTFNVILEVEKHPQSKAFALIKLFAKKFQVPNYGDIYPTFLYVL